LGEVLGLVPVGHAMADIAHQPDLVPIHEVVEATQVALGDLGQNLGVLGGCRQLVRGVRRFRRISSCSRSYLLPNESYGYTTNGRKRIHSPADRATARPQECRLILRVARRLHHTCRGSRGGPARLTCQETAHGHAGVAVHPGSIADGLLLRAGCAGDRLCVGHVGRCVGVADRKIAVDHSILLRIFG